MTWKIRKSRARRWDTAFCRVLCFKRWSFVSTSWTSAAWFSRFCLFDLQEQGTVAFRHNSGIKCSYKRGQLLEECIQNAKIPSNATLKEESGIHLESPGNYFFKFIPAGSKARYIFFQFTKFLVTFLFGLFTCFCVFCIMCIYLCANLFFFMSFTFAL